MKATEKEKMNVTILKEVEWASATLADPKATPENRKKASAIMDKQIKIEEEVVVEFDDIMDIEDDDEREAAFEKWFAEQEKNA